MTKWMVVVLIMLAAVGTARAQSAFDVAANCKELLEGMEILSADRMNVPATFSAGQCWGAIGAIQMMIGLVDTSDERLLEVCAPTKAKRHQLVSVFVQYVDANPAIAHEDHFTVAVWALQAAFPCSN